MSNRASRPRRRRGGLPSEGFFEAPWAGSKRADGRTATHPTPLTTIAPPIPTTTNSQAAMARFPSLCLRLVFASGVVLATAFSLQAPLRSGSAATQGKGLAFVQPKAAAPAAAAVPVVGKNE